MKTESRLANLYTQINWIKSVGGDCMIMPFVPTENEVLLLRDNGVIVKTSEGRLIAEFY